MTQKSQAALSASIDSSIFDNDFKGITPAIARTVFHDIADSCVQVLGLQNRVINGNFNLWRRGTTLTGVTSAYTADCWKITYTNSPTITVAKLAAPSGMRGQNVLNMLSTGVVAGTVIELSHYFESSALADLDGKSITVSLDINASTSAGDLSFNIQFKPFTATDNGTLGSNLFSSSIAVPTGAATISTTVGGSSTIGLKTGGALILSLTQNTSSGNINVSYGAVQLEYGIVANPFEIRPYGLEVELANRFFETSYTHNVAPGTTAVSSFGNVAQATQNFTPIACPYKTTKRSATPTVTLYSTVGGATGKFYDMTGTADVAATVSVGDSKGHLAMVNNVSVTAGHVLQVHWTASAEF